MTVKVLTVNLIKATSKIWLLQNASEVLSKELTLPLLMDKTDARSFPNEIPKQVQFTQSILCFPHLFIDKPENLTTISTVNREDKVDSFTITLANQLGGMQYSKRYGMMDRMITDDFKLFIIYILHEPISLESSDLSTDSENQMKVNKQGEETYNYTSGTNDVSMVESILNQMPEYSQFNFSAKSEGSMMNSISYFDRRVLDNALLSSSASNNSIASKDIRTFFMDPGPNVSLNPNVDDFKEMDSDLKKDIEERTLINNRLERLALNSTMGTVKNDAEKNLNKRNKMEEKVNADMFKKKENKIEKDELNAVADEDVVFKAKGGSSKKGKKSKKA